MICLDTSIIIEARKGKIKIEREDVCTTVYTVFELERGAINNKRERKFIEEFKKIVPVFSLEGSERIAAEIFEELKRKGEIIPLIDIFIAAVCIKHGFELWTKDKHFEIIKKYFPELRVKIW